MQSSNDLQCRLCLSKVYRMHNFIRNPKSTDFEMSIPESIEDFFKIKISADDFYSKFVCANCLTIIHMIHIHRKRVQTCQKHLTPAKINQMKIKEDIEQICSHGFQKEELIVNEPSNIEQKQGTDDSKIRVPFEYFNTNNPTVAITFEEKKLANAVALQEWQENETLEREPKMIRVELKEDQRCETSFNITEEKQVKEPYVARDLVHEKFSGMTYDKSKIADIIGCELNNRKKSIETEDLFYISMQLDVSVCNICDKVFEKYCDLRSHMKKHAKIMDMV